MTTLEYAQPRPGKWGDLMARRESGLLVLLVLVVGGVTLRNPQFLAPDNVWDLLAACTQPAIVSCGVMLVIVTGEIDISVGGALGFLTAMLGWMASPTHWGWPPWLAVLAMLAMGAVIGLVNGLLVTLVRVPSIIVTLATMTILKGLNTLLLKPGDITDMPAGVRLLGVGALPLYPGAGRGASLPVSLILTGAVVAATGILIVHTPIGRRIYAVGSNAHAARLAGISVTRTRIFVFALTGFLVGVAVLVTRLATVTSGLGTGLELLVVTCVVVGGVSISGGSGTLLGVMLGVALLSIQKPVLIFLNWGSNAAYWEKAIQGALILAAVLADHLAGRRRGSRGHG